MTKVYREKHVDNRCNPSSSSIWRWRGAQRDLGANRLAEKRQTNLDSANWQCCTAHEHRQNRGRWFEQIDQKSPSNCHFEPLFFTATSRKFTSSQKVKNISPSRSLPMRTVCHCLRKDGNSAKRHRVSAPTQYKKERENKITVFHFTFHLGTQPVKHPAPRPLHLHSIHCCLRDVPRLQ